MFEKRTQVLKISFLAIFSAFVVELILGLISNSLALVADSIHALLDSVVTIVLLLAARWAIKPPDAEHTYGHGKMESLGGFIGGVAILALACFFIYESIHRLQSPPPSVLPGLIAIIGGVYTIGIDVLRIVILHRSVKRIGGSTLKADLYHAFTDLGSTAIAIGGIVLVTYGWYFGDFVAALILGMVLAVLSLRLIYRTSLDLTDAIAPELVKKVREITLSTQGVVDAGAILMRRSGDIIFMDITVSLRGDTSFDKAHKISDDVAKNVQDEIKNASITVHFEPNWDGVSPNTRILEIAMSVKGVREVNNISTNSIKGEIYCSLHVMVDRDSNLLAAHTISEMVEKRVQEQMPKITHVTVHLEPFVKIPKDFNKEDTHTKEKIDRILDEYADIKKVGRIASLRFGNVLKIDIDCSFEKELSIEKVHDITSEIEQSIRAEIKNSVITIHPEPY